MGLGVGGGRIGTPRYVPIGFPLGHIARMRLSDLRLLPLGMASQSPMGPLWCITKALVAAEVQRPYRGPEVPQLIAEACSTEAERVVYTACLLLFPSLARVGEVSSARRSGVGKSHFSYGGLKRNERWVTRHVGPFALAWARWLRRHRQGSNLVLGSAALLEEGMDSLLKGTDRQETRRHAWRRGRAYHLLALSLPWSFLCWWSRWDSIKIAAYYASAPNHYPWSFI